jgi:ubiquinone/menaquinone biosynthesis C-methylase UbiE
MEHGMTIHKCDPDGFRQTIKNAVSGGRGKVLRWYAECASLARGKKVWTTQFEPFVNQYLSEQYQRHSCLEIGYGAGSILAHAAGTFDLVAGIDVHDEHDFMAEILVDFGLKKEQFDMKTTEGSQIPYEDKTFDLVYSWTVFMHLGLAKVALAYLKEAYRVLRPGGIAIIYFTRVLRTKKNQTWEEVLNDIQEELDRKIEYREKPGVAVNRINLALSLWWVEEQAMKIGFKTMCITASSKRLDNIPFYHGQYGIVLRRGQSERVFSGGNS